MYIPEQSALICRTCSKKHGIALSPAAIWHYATCVRCHNKDAVAQPAEPLPHAA